MVKEKKGQAIASIVLGALFFIPLAPIVGLILGIIAYRKAQDKTLSIIGIVICSIGSLVYAITILGLLLSLIKSLIA
ncbi:unnamed protein product [marine sediment metagenome]|uniref:DUF4190 domain-containing protein n=1 Tax=marine sediment metagenome TaxID=412755 RepID=X0VZC6_9ZZZZ